MRELKRFFIALGFFTRLPVPAWVGYQPEELNRSSRYFPLVGGLVGALCAVALLGLTKCLPDSLAVLLSMILSLIITGGFHEDGLADCADAFGGGWEKENVLRIMKDSRLGSYGVLTMTMALMVKFSALQFLLGLSVWPALFALLVAHSLSRASALWIMARLDYVRDTDTSKAKPIAQEMNRTDLLIGSMCGLLPSVILVCINPLLWPVLTASFIWSVLAFWGAGRYFFGRLGGYTGDCLGAAQQISELGIYCLFCAFMIL